MIKDNGFENTSGNGELEDELLEALNKKGLLPTDEENAADGETAGPGEDAEDVYKRQESALGPIRRRISRFSYDASAGLW